VKPFRPMTRYLSLTRAILLGFVLALPLLRLAWDQWVQSLVGVSISFLVVLGCVLVLMGRTADGGRGLSVTRSYGPFGAVVLLASLVSTFQSSYLQSALPGLLNDFPAWAFFFVGAVSQGETRILFRRAFAGAGLVAIVAAFLYAVDRTGPWTGPLVNPNIFAALVLLTAPALFDFAFDPSSSRWVRSFWIGALVLMGTGLVLSRSLVGVAVAVIQGTVALGYRWTKSEGRKTLLLLLVVAIGGVGLYLNQADWGKVFRGDPDRLTWMGTAFEIFKAHPIFGAGPGTFGEAYPAFRTDPWGLNSLYVHNFVLEWLAERGAAGGGVLILFIVVLVGRNWRTYRKTGLGLGLAGFCLFNLFHIGFSFPGLYWLFFLGLGLTVGEESESASTDEIAGNSIASKWIVAPLVVWSLVGLSFFAVFRANQLCEKARMAAHANRFEMALEWLDQGLRWNRWYPPLYELRAIVRIQKQDWDGASADLERATELAPTRAGYRMELAELALEKGDRGRALREYEKATHLLPLKAAAWERWGDLLAADGKKEEASRAYDGALRALADPRVLGGDPDRRAETARRIEGKRRHEK
jgi:predicted negative regulator of RcsB-dependent stress response